jgi:hypothetical protein
MYHHTQMLVWVREGENRGGRREEGKRERERTYERAPAIFIYYNWAKFAN